MTIWDWKCVRCGFVKEAMQPSACPQCGDRLRKKYSVHTPHPNHFFRPHWNRSIGQWVTSQQDFNSKLKKKGDEMSARLGMDHNYEPHEHGDKIGVTDAE